MSVTFSRLSNALRSSVRRSSGKSADGEGAVSDAVFLGGQKPSQKRRASDDNDEEMSEDSKAQAVVEAADEKQAAYEDARDAKADFQDTYAEKGHHMQPIKAKFSLFTTSKFKILIGFVQVISALRVTYVGIPWPSVFKELSANLQFVNLGIMQLSTVEW